MPAELQVETLPRTTLRLHAHSMRRDEIVSGRLRPGDKVNEVRISAPMDVSRGTVREAMRVLEQEGLLCSLPHRGTYVRRIDAREARELQEVRLALEITAAVHDALIWSAKIERFLAGRHRRLERTYRQGSFLERVRADLSFHEVIRRGLREPDLAANVALARRQHHRDGAARQGGRDDPTPGSERPPDAARRGGLVRRRGHPRDVHLPLREGPAGSGARNGGA